MPSASQRIFRLITTSTFVHEPERFMVYFEQIAPQLGSPFAIDPLLDFFSTKDAEQVGVLQFQQNIDDYFQPGDQLIIDHSRPAIIKSAE